MSILSESIGNKIKRVRIQKSLTQEKIAEKLYMTPAGFGKIERGETDITLKKLEQICEALEVSVFQIISLDDKNVFNVNDNALQYGTLGYMNHIHSEKNETTLKLFETLKEELQEKNDIIKKLLEIVKTR